MKIVINKSHGGFGLSHEGILRYAEIKGIALYLDWSGKFSGVIGPTYWTTPETERGGILGDEDYFEASPEERAASNKLYGSLVLNDRDIPRDDPALVQVVEEMGEAAKGQFAYLEVVEIPDGISWQIDEYDGLGTIHEVHKSWG